MLGPIVFPRFWRLSPPPRINKNIHIPRSFFKRLTTPHPYTQDTYSDHFKDGRSVAATAKEIACAVRTGRCNPQKAGRGDAHPMLAKWLVLEVVYCKKTQAYYSFNNRRLAALRTMTRHLA